MAKYRVSYDRSNCIGEYACSEAAPQFWKCDKDGKASLKDAKYNPQTKWWEIIIDEHDYDDMQAAAEACPMHSITITKISDDPSEGNFGDWKEDEPKDWEPSIKEPNCPVKE
jgi:ferredoxin